MGTRSQICCKKSAGETAELLCRHAKAVASATAIAPAMPSGWL
ncbi:MAG TPA: hypothetical protein VKB49_08965 [Candidatus Sulfotelmatobacter sp.]|nr:hypothetical protein [Candidatus Sulfotelmatobacter sp.]